MITVLFLLLFACVWLGLRLGKERTLRRNAEVELAKVTNHRDYFMHQSLALEGKLRCDVCGEVQPSLSAFRRHLEAEQRALSDGELTPQQSARLLVALGLSAGWLHYVDDSDDEEGRDSA